MSKPRKIQALKPKVVTQVSPVVATIVPAQPTKEQAEKIVLNTNELAEIQQLERAIDFEKEETALSQVYRKLRFQFYAGIENQSESNPKLARASEINTAPEETLLENPPSALNQAQLEPQTEEKIEESSEEAVSARTEDPKPNPSNENDRARTVVVEAEETLKERDVLAITQSSRALTAPTIAVEESREGLKNTPIVTALLDEVPNAEALSTQADTQRIALGGKEKDEGVRKTGPPESHTVLNLEEVRVYPAPDEKTAAPETLAHDLNKMNTQSDLPAPEAEDEYSKDIAAAFDETAGYPESEDSDQSVQADQDHLDDEKSQKANPNTQKLASGGVVDYGHGVRRDAQGITIDYNERSPDSRGRQTGPIYVGRPDSAISAPNPQKQKPINTTLASVVQLSSVKTEPKDKSVMRCESGANGIEAYSPSENADRFSSCTLLVSPEGKLNGRQKRWWETHAAVPGYWPTLHLSDADFLTAQTVQGTSIGKTVPLLSSSFLRVNSLLARTNIHRGMGIVFGRALSHQEVKVLGRSEAPHYFEGGAGRNFIIYNVEPGHLLIEVKDLNTGAIAVAPMIVKPNVATFFAPTSIETANLEVEVLDATSRTARPMKGITLEIIGHSRHTAITNAQGVAKIQNLPVIRGYPIHFDVLKNNTSFRQRFRALVETEGQQTAKHRAYFFDEKRIRSWTEQLSGGLSPLSGMMIGAYPRANDGKERSAEIVLRRLNPRSELSPELYYLGKNERLSVEPHKAGTKNTRYLAVQIPEGGILPSWMGTNGVQWSQVVHAQPGVLNVIVPE